MPTVLRPAQRVVIEILILGYLSLQRDISSHIKAVLIQKQSRKKSAHPAVAVIERMNAEKIMNKYGNGYQRLNLSISRHNCVFFAYPVQRLGRFKRRKRREQYLRASVRIRSAYIILHVLGFARHRIAHMRVKHFVQLQDVVARERNGVKALVYDIERVAIAGDLLLVAVPRRSLFLDQLPDARARGHDALNGIGRLGALDLSYIDQFIQFLRRSLQAHFLLARLLVNRRNETEDLGIPLGVFEIGIVESPHI